MKASYPIQPSCLCGRGLSYLSNLFIIIGPSRGYLVALLAITPMLCGIYLVLFEESRFVPEGLVVILYKRVYYSECSFL
jgi:hypothetical protein